jgi:hypothetical protein
MVGAKAKGRLVKGWEGTTFQFQLGVDSCRRSEVASGCSGEKRGPTGPQWRGRVRLV